jgi:uncharacterized membrane protein (UPF0136 family)
MVAAGAALFTATYAVSQGNTAACNIAMAVWADIVAGIELTLVSVRHPAASVIAIPILAIISNTAGYILGLQVCS